MKKIIFVILFLLLWIFQTYADIWTSTVNWVYNDWVKDCPNWVISHWVQHYWVPQTNTTWLPVNWSATCGTHAYYTWADYTITFSTHNKITNCNSWDRIISISPVNCYNYWTCTITCRKHDDTPPQYSDIIFAPTNLLAQTNYIYNLSVASWWWVPVVSLSWYYERWDNPNLTWAISLTSVNWNFTYNSWNIRDVDNLSLANRSINWAREYSFVITKLCDSLWNCSTVPYEKIHNIYANISNITTKSIITNQLNTSTNYADWNTKYLSMTLKDTYWNQIVPASWVWRTIDFNFDVSNTLYLNQYSRNWQSSVFVSSSNWSDYTNKLALWNNINSLNSQNTSNWIYNFWFKVYTPTSNQDNTPISDTNSDLYINNITFDINDATFWSYNWISLNWFSQIRAKFSPLYYTRLMWDLISNWLIEWVVQSWSIQVFKNWWVSTSFNNIWVEFWSWTSNSFSPKLNLKYWSNSSSVNSPVWEWNLNVITFTSPFRMWFSTWTFPFYSKLQLQTWATLNDIQNSYISTHISYNITAPNWVWTINPIYNSDIYWKDSYWWVAWSGNTYQSAIKIIWKTYSDKYTEIISWQSWSWVILLNWNITKSWLKTDIRRNTYDLIKSTPVSNWWNIVNNFDFSNDEDWKELLNWNVLYFWKLSWQNVNVNAWTVTWNKTIIIEWWNAYIKGNINTSWVDSILWLVVLKDNNWNWWNIYIDPNVSYIKAVMYADKSLISYDWTNELWWDTNFTTLKNQLYILGSVFSENTIGWSRWFPIKCPYYITNCSSVEEAQKYDLNYLRRYYIKDDKTSPGCTPWPDWKINSCDSPAWWWIPYFSPTSPNYTYPVIIEYNPLIQTNPPIVFKK